MEKEEIIRVIQLGELFEWVGQNVSRRGEGEAVL